MSVYGSTNSPAFKSNVKLCRAIKKHPILYDPKHEYHRKRLPSENSWDMVASETGVSVEKCKRRWRQIRNDYIRWINTDDHRQRNGLKRPTFYLTDELKFFNPHMSFLDLSDREMDSSERERDSKSTSKEPVPLEESYKDKDNENSEAVDEQPLSKLKVIAKTQLEGEKVNLKNTKEEEKGQEKPMGEETLKSKEKQSKADKELKEKEADNKDKDKAKDQKKAAKSCIAEQEENSSGESGQELPKDKDKYKAPPSGDVEKTISPNHKKPQFFVKQSNKSSPNCLIIGKKPTESVSFVDANSFENMADDSLEETASLGGGRRLRRGPGRIKQLAIQKSVTEQRQTRLQRRKSMTVAAANSLRSSTSPVKMTPVPRVFKTKATAKATTAKQTSVSSSRDDIFPRPRASAQIAQQLVLARRPGPVPFSGLSQTQPQQSTAQTFPVRPYNGIGRPPGPARVAVTPSGNRPFAVPMTPVHRAPSLEPKKAPAVPVASSSASASASASSSSSPSPPLQRLVSSSNTLVISTTSSPMNSNNSITISTSNSNSAVNTASISASPIVSSAPSVMSIMKHSERSTQTETLDVFSDDHFLDMLRPQMREMNPRQKMHFKQKIFQALMETFDDATDFPNSGEVQHFNINTPSGYDHVTDPELRLIRELVSLVSAAKHTSFGGGASTAVPAKAVSALRTTANKVAQRIYKQSPGTPVTSADEEKKIYRILPNNNNKLLPGGYAYPSQLVAARNDSIDSNISTRTAPGRVTFVVPATNPKTQRIVDPLTSLFAAGTAPAGATKQAPGIAGQGVAAKEPGLVRQMGRRYSVCGSSGAPMTNLGQSSNPGNGIVAAGSVSSTATSSATALENMPKRRIVSPSSSMAPPQQRARYSHSPQAQGAQGAQGAGVAPAIAPGSSLLVRRAGPGAGSQKQLSPPGGNSVTPKTPQISSIQGGTFNAFATPSPGGASACTTPLKRGMVIASIKDTTQQKSGSSAVRAGRPRLTDIPPAKANGSANVANLLAESRAPTSTQLRAKPTSVAQPQPQPLPQILSQAQSQPDCSTAEKEQEQERSDMAGTIAADFFDMSRLKREPQDIIDDDILGM